MMHSTVIGVSFGDCDPAGIVFYPNYFKWMDKTFHDWLRHFGGHAAICRNLQSVGIGLIDASMRFQSPTGDGDEIRVVLDTAEWTARTLVLTYRLTSGERPVALGREVRGLFTRTETGIQAADIMVLRDFLARRS